MLLLSSSGLRTPRLTRDAWMRTSGNFISTKILIEHNHMQNWVDVRRKKMLPWQFYENLGQ
eukprot:m.42179 g.42179  ORF g.42179 m.42179 type:complete len:61 (-) comp9852_c1_seq1:1306-1488(-)